VQPSEAYIKNISKFKDAALMHDITLLDLWIITNDGYYIMSDMGFS